MFFYFLRFLIIQWKITLNVAISLLIFYISLSLSDDFGLVLSGMFSKDCKLPTFIRSSACGISKKLRIL